MHQLYQCRGRHFKAYNSQQAEVLEHPADTESVHLSFFVTAHALEKRYFVIKVEEYIHTPMRIAGQKARIDIYVLQHLFRPLIDDILPDQLTRPQIQHTEARNWRYGAPFARNGRQGVPNLVKLAEVQNVGAIVPFRSGTLRLADATMIIDSEIPGRDQPRWAREGGSRQVHMGIFGGKWTPVERHEKSVRVGIPLAEMRNNFLLPILTNWVDG